MNKNKKNKFRVCELFAGVGGFHLGLKKSGWKIVWANQWEPGKKEQYAFNCYTQRFKNKGQHSNQDISIAKQELKKEMFDLLVGGFPCQDYSVATTKAQGIQGKKGVLWWQIDDIIAKCCPPYILLENVDRLLRSPSKQRGRDFGMILACLYRHGYYVEWRMINAAEYGFPQKRRRTFIFATRNSGLIKELTGNRVNHANYLDVLEKTGFFAKPFPVNRSTGNGNGQIELFNNIEYGAEIKPDLQKMSDSFVFHFANAGLLYKKTIYTAKLESAYKGKRMNLRDILKKRVDKKYYISQNELEAWKYHKGPKKVKRTNAAGFKYYYSEGGIPFPEKLDGPSRTMLTSEGNKRPNRITHVVEFPEGSGKYRILTPEETEKLNGFPENWTNTGMPERWRYFCMGNALVVGLIEIMGKRLKALIYSM